MSSNTVSEELAQLQAILDTLTDAIVMCRYDVEVDDAVCVWCNRATLLATGLTRDEVIGSPPRRLLPAAGELEDPTTRRRLFDAVRTQGFLELERPLEDPGMPEGTLLRVRVYSPGPESDVYILQTELVGERRVTRIG